MCIKIIEKNVGITEESVKSVKKREKFLIERECVRERERPRFK